MPSAGARRRWKRREEEKIPPPPPGSLSQRRQKRLQRPIIYDPCVCSFLPRRCRCLISVRRPSHPIGKWRGWGRDWDGIWVWGCGRICGEMCGIPCTIMRFHYKILQLPHIFPYPNPIPSREVCCVGGWAIGRHHVALNMFNATYPTVEHTAALTACMCPP